MQNDRCLFPVWPDALLPLLFRSVCFGYVILLLAEVSFDPSFLHGLEIPLCKYVSAMGRSAVLEVGYITTGCLPRK